MIQMNTAIIAFSGAALVLACDSTDMECMRSCKTISQCRLNDDFIGNNFDECMSNCAFADARLSRSVSGCAGFGENIESSCVACADFAHCLEAVMEAPVVRDVDILIMYSNFPHIDRQNILDYSCHADDLTTPRVAAVLTSHVSVDWHAFCADMQAEMVEIGVENVGTGEAIIIATGECTSTLGKGVLRGKIPWGFYQMFVRFWDIDANPAESSCRKYHAGHMAILQDGPRTLYLPSDHVYDCEATPMTCVDGADNDHDHKIDCEDFECVDVCRELLESSK